MKQFILSGLVVILTTGLLESPRVHAQTPAATAAPIPHKVGLIDMAYIFKNYKKFDVLREDLKGEIEQSDQQAKQMAEAIKLEQDKLKALEEGSPGYANQERVIAQKISDFETFRKVAQRDFLRKESQIYKTVYLEVTDAVTKYADYYKYTLILRFNRESLEDNANNPQEIIQRMNRQVVYHRAQEDITDAVLDFLNKRYAPNIKPVSGTKP